MSFCVLCLVFFFFFKQKTAYEMRISDWSSDVCSSDLRTSGRHARPEVPTRVYPMLDVLANRTYRHLFLAQIIALVGTGLATVALGLLAYEKIGRASCRERVCQYV